MNKSKQSAGFTILELLVSMTVFSLMLIVASMTILQIGKMYYKGVNNIRTQDTANDIMAIVTEQVQFSVSGVTTNTWTSPEPNPVTINSVCVGTTRFSYVLQRRLVVGAPYNNATQQMPHVLWQDTQDDNMCTPINLTTLSLTDGRELLSENTRLVTFGIASVNGATVTSNQLELVRIAIHIVNGDNNLLEGFLPAEPADTVATGCAGGVVGSQWCASAQLQTLVTRRMQ